MSNCFNVRRSLLYSTIIEMTKNHFIDDLCLLCMLYRCHI
jgi:hypothetical protein